MKLKFLITILLILFGLLSCENDRREPKPNIVLINVDDLGWKDLGFMGSDYYETPHIDALSAEGMVFSNGYASAANCAPSRACLMTGQWTTRHGVYTVGTSERGAAKHRKIIPQENRTALLKNQQVISRILQKNGYATCHSGKWHLSTNPQDFGFDLNLGGGHNGHPTSYYPPYKNVEILRGEAEHLTDLIMEQTLHFLDTVREPFFVNYAPYAVHTPVQAVDSILPRYMNKEPAAGQTNPSYATMIDNLDRNIGLLVAKLKQRKLYNNTLIVFTSDNGGLYGITQQLPLRAGKGSYYEGGIRTPFFFVLKNRIEEGSSCDIPITNLDLFPTLLGFAKIDTAAFKFDGDDLGPVLDRKQESLDRSLFWHFPVYLEAYNPIRNENRDSLFRTRPGSVIRNGDWKLHYYFENNDLELFNLRSDIGESSNLVRSEPEKVKQLLGLLESWWELTGAPIPNTPNPQFEDQ